MLRLLALLAVALVPPAAARTPLYTSPGNVCFVAVGNVGSWSYKLEAVADALARYRALWCAPRPPPRLRVRVRQWGVTARAPTCTAPPGLPPPRSPMSQMPVLSTGNTILPTPPASPADPVIYGDWRKCALVLAASPVYARV